MCLETVHQCSQIWVSRQCLVSNSHIVSYANSGNMYVMIFFSTCTLMSLVLCISRMMMTIAFPSQCAREAEIIGIYKKFVTEPTTQ